MSNGTRAAAEPFPFHSGRLGESRRSEGEYGARTSPRLGSLQSNDFLGWRERLTRSI